MQFSFNKLYDDCLLESRVLAICGTHQIFNQMAIDRLKFACQYQCLKQLGMSTDGEEFSLKSIGNLLDFDTFMTYGKSPAFVGKWFCVCNYKALNSKQKETLKAYLQAPSKYGVLVIEVDDFQLFRNFTHNRVFSNSKEINVIKLSYPSNNVLKRLVLDSLNGIKIADKALELFLLKLGDAYDQYTPLLEKLKGSGLKSIDYAYMQVFLKDVEYIKWEDFIDMLLNPPRVNTQFDKHNYPTSKKKGFSAIYSITKSMGGRKVVNILRLYINQLVELRSYINKGYIPGTLEFSITSFKDKLEETNEFKTMSDFLLKKRIDLALKTTLNDLIHIKLILDTQPTQTDRDCQQVLIYILLRSKVDALCLQSMMNM